MAGMYGCFKGRNSDSAAMASRPPDLTNQEPAEVQEECSGKKKSKFQTFKKLFARKKRKEPSTGGVDDGLKASQSSDNVSKTSENTLTRSEKEKGSGSKISLGNKALSHDSIFVSDSSEASEALGASQDSIHGKVKSLQLQLKQAIRLGSPPSLMCVKKMEDAGTMSEDDGLPCSPPEYTTLHTVMHQAQRNSSNSLQRVDSDDDQLSCGASSRAVSPLVVPGDFSQPASPFGCLDNSAAKHKLGLRHKACNKRKPARQLEGKVERDSSVEENISVPGAEAEDIKEQEQQMAEDAADDELKPKVEREEEEDDKDEENGQPRDPTVSLLTDKEKGEEGEDESEAEQDVSHDPDTSCPPMPGLSEEEASDDQPPSSSKLSSRSSSLDSLRATPEPPAGPREYLMDPPGASYGAEDNLIAERDSASEEDDLVQDISDEESSLLEEVLNSLKTPLTSCPVDVEPEGVTLEMDKEEERGVELVGDEDEVEEPVGYQPVPSDSILLDQTAEEEKEVKSPSLQEEEEVTAVGEEVKGRAEEVEDEEEVLIVERFTQHSDEEEGEQEEEDQPQNMLTRQSISQQAEEGEEEESEREEEEEPIELEKEPEVEKEGWERGEEAADDDDDDDDDDDGEMAVEVHEEREVEEEEKMIPDSQAEEVQSASWQEADEDEVFQDAFVYIKHTEDNNSTGNGNEVITSLQEEEENFRHEEEDGEKEGEEVDLIEQKSEEDVKEDHDAEQTEQEQDQDQESDEKVTFLDTKELQKDPSEPAVAASSKPPPLSLPGSHHRTHLDDGVVSPPSRTSTLQISLVSPSSEKAASLFQLSPAAADPSESITESPSPGSDSIEPNAAPEQEAAGTVEDEEEKQSNQKPEDPPSAAVGGAATQPTDQSKIRFTIAPAWQRSQSLSPPSSPPTHVSLSSGITKPTADEVGAAADGVRKAESVGPAKAEDVLSPGSVRNAGIKAQVSAAASTAERSVVAEGNPDSPFGVRLRKTSALLRFSSEEENPEPPSESPSQPTGCKADSPQPISNKPALPKKPEGHVDAGGKPRRISDPAPGWGVSGGADPPSWISVAKQKQKVYKENSLDEITAIKEEQERKSSLPTYVSSAASSNKTAESASKVGQSEVSKPTVSVEKETKKTLSPPTPVPPQPLKSQPLPCPVAPKPQRPSATAKPPPQPDSPQRSLSPPAPVPVPSKSPPCTTPSYLSKTATSPKTPTVTSPPFSSRTVLEKPGPRAPGLPGQAVSSQRGLPPSALPQDEPPWMALAKKKAKAWSEMPQIVQ